MVGERGGGGGRYPLTCLTFAVYACFVLRPLHWIRYRFTDDVCGAYTDPYRAY